LVLPQGLSVQMTEKLQETIGITVSFSNLR